MPRRLNAEPDSRPRATRIAMQHFRGDTLVCELRTAETSLIVHISRADGEENRNAGWRIEAHDKVVGEDIVVAASGPTRRAALAEVSRQWSERGPVLGLHLVDWDAIAVALSSVRAIE